MSFQVTFTVTVEGQASATEAVREAARRLLEQTTEDLAGLAAARRLSDATLPLFRDDQPRARTMAATTRSLGEPASPMLRRPPWWPYALTLPTRPR